MLVCNESAIIERCLATLQDFISHYYIIDTCSSDDTGKTVNKMLRGAPGCVVKRPFSSFSLLKEELYREASKLADYVLFVNADETLQASNNKVFRENLPDIGLVEIDFKSHSHRQPRLIRSGLSISCTGYVSEQLVHDDSHSVECIANLKLIDHQDGYRSHHKDQRRSDTNHLLGELGSSERDPEILLALGKLHYPEANATVFFHDCITSTDNERILWHAYYWLGKIAQQEGMHYETAIKYYMAAYDLYPDRAEPLRGVIDCLKAKGDIETADSLTEIAGGIDLPKNADYFESSIYL
jgi:tetratricopeptide (TPR) repeat protein